MQATLVRIPGNMCDARLWRDVQIMADWPVVDAPMLSEDSISAMASSVLSAVAGAVIPIGFSMGGIVALEMARQAPARVKAMVLVDTNAGADLPERAALRPHQQLRVKAGEMADIIADELKPAYLAKTNRDNALLKQLLFDMAIDLGEAVFVAQSEALRTRADLWPALEEFAGPIFLMCGAEDRLCSPELHALMAQRAMTAEFNIIAGAGHMLPLEQPNAFSAALNVWLEHRKGAL